jgi:hypothetical protein
MALSATASTTALSTLDASPVEASTAPASSAVFAADPYVTHPAAMINQPKVFRIDRIAYGIGSFRPREMMVNVRPTVLMILMGREQDLTLTGPCC